MSEFEFPTNIRQIGSIGAGLKIYVEDYVCSYLQQYAANGGYEERLAFLIGRQMIIDNTEVLFISGAVEGRNIVENKGIMTFGSMSFDYAREQIKKYFDSLEIVGWMQSQPGYGTFLNANYAAFHLETFKKPYQVLFIIDPIEKLNAFYYFDKAKADLSESRGYFIYYEKNTGMHEYMLQHKMDKPNTYPGEQDDAEERIVREADVHEEQRTRESLDVMDTPYFRRLRDRDYNGRAERIQLTEKKGYGNKRIVNLLSSLCAVLILVCVVMGAGLVQNDDRISSLEGQLIDLNTLYKNLLVQTKQSTPVFAADEEANKNVITENDIASGADENQNQQAQVITENGNLLTETVKPEVKRNEETTSAAVSEELNSETPDDTAASVASNTASSVESNTASDIPETYTVQEGDNLNYISIKFYGNKNMIDKIMEVNGIDNPDTIYFGKVLILPRP